LVLYFLKFGGKPERVVPAGDPDKEEYFVLFPGPDRVVPDGDYTDPPEAG
jgi:hypothetical protein